jgi:hypothetical protein
MDWNVRLLCDSTCLKVKHSEPSLNSNLQRVSWRNIPITLIEDSPTISSVSPA